MQSKSILYIITIAYFASNLIIAKTLNSTEIIRAMEKNAFEHVTLFPPNINNIAIQKTCKAHVVSSSIKDSRFNVVWNMHWSEDESHEEIKKLVTLFKKNNAPSEWGVSLSCQAPNLYEELKSYGTVHQEIAIGMYTHITNFFKKQDNLIIKRVYNTDTLHDYCNVIISTKNNPQEYKKIIMGFSHHIFSDNDPYAFYVGYHNGKPVACAELFFANNIAGIHGLNIMPSYQRKNFGAAMIKHLLNKSLKKDYTIATLQTLSQNIEFYKMLGFKELCAYKLYILSFEEDYQKQP